MSESLCSLLINFLFAQAQTVILLLTLLQTFIVKKPQQIVSLVCHYHIVQPHLINEGFEAVLIVIFKRDLPHVTLLMCAY